MAITISGENNNDRILAQDGVIDEISGINIVGLLTAGHINVGSNINLGNAGIITATTFIGNLTGNVNNTSPLLLQTGGSERFRITGNNELGIAGANYGSSGQVLTSGGSGNAVTWSAIPSQVNIVNNSDNRVITGGSGVNLNGEANLTFDGSTLGVNGNLSIADKIIHTGDTNCFISFPAADQIVFEGGGHERFRINGTTGRYLFGRDITGRAANYNNTSVVPIIQIEDDTEASFSVAKFSNNTDSSRIYLQKGRGSTGSAVVVQDNDTLGMIVFNGYNGSGFRNAAQILAEVDGEPTSSGDDTDMPGALVFKTSEDGSAIPSERLRIHSGGMVEANSSFGDTYSTTTSINPHLRVRNQQGADNIYGGIQLRADRNNGAAAIFNIACLNSSTNYASELIFQSRNTDGNFSEKLRIASNGYVGINTTGPSQQFTSYAASGYPVLANGPSNGIGLGGNGAIVFGTKDLGSYGPGVLDGSTLEFKISGSPKLNITSGGQVQISGGSTPLKVTHTGADCAQFHRGSKYLGINADWGGNTGDSVISVSTNFVVHTNGSSERFRIASDGTTTFGNNTNNGTYVTIDAVTNNGRVRIGAPNQAVAKGKVIIDNADRNAMSDITNPDNYGVVLCGSSTSGHGNGITFCNDNAQNAGAGIVHVDEGSNNLGSLRFYTKDEGQVPYETLRMGKFGNLVTSTASWRSASEKYVDTLHMPQAHEGYHASSSYSGLSVAAEMWHQSHVRGTSHLTTELFSTRMGHNAGMFIYVEVWFSCAVSNYQGYQALWANANRTGSNNFTINNTGQEGNQLGTDTGNYFNLTYASAGSAGNQRLTWKVTTSFGNNYTRVLYKSTVVGHDYFTDLTVIR